MSEYSVQQLLASYPRRRLPLTPAHEKIYVEEYKLNRSGEGLLFKATQCLESWMHKMAANRGGCGSILELGAGSLNHVPIFLAGAGVALYVGSFAIWMVILITNPLSTAYPT